ncbi:hypothetical protein J1614_011056 [Plenodomus biglobosus]|nr:hypothetical protein J1614_011056 [Plenodomus biglobosus]
MAKFQPGAGAVDNHPITSLFKAESSPVVPNARHIHKRQLPIESYLTLESSKKRAHNVSEPTLGYAAGIPEESIQPLQPFRTLSVYLCPFKTASRPCGHKTGRWFSAASRNKHVSMSHAHQDPTTTMAEDPLEDGNIKILCPKGCHSKFTSYTQATQHAKSKTRRSMGAKISPMIPCLWKPFNDCDSSSTERFPITSAAQKGTPPSIIVVGRSSGSIIPADWYAKRHDLRVGLPLWGKKIVEHYAAYSAVQGAHSVIVHACYQVQTRDLPALEHNDSHREAKESRRLRLSRAHKFTEAITKDIIASNVAGIEPILLSVGLDGWACDTRMILPWLTRLNLRFKLVIRLTALQYGISASCTKLRGKVYWSEYNSADLVVAMHKGSSADVALKELIDAWDLLQYRKDLRVENPLFNGRNDVDFSAKYPPIV